MYPRDKLIFSELKKKRIEDRIKFSMEYDSSEVLNLLREKVNPGQTEK
jgi:hypothetical protein